MAESNSGAASLKLNHSGLASLVHLRERQETLPASNPRYSTIVCAHFLLASPKTFEYTNFLMKQIRQVKKSITADLTLYNAVLRVDLILNLIQETKPILLSRGTGTILQGAKLLARRQNAPLVSKLSERIASNLLCSESAR